MEDVALRRLRELFHDPVSRSQVVSMVAREVERIVHSRVKSLEGVKGWLVRHFMANDVQHLIRKIPGDVDTFLAALADGLAQREVRDYFRGIIERFLDDIWTAEIRDLRPWLPAEFVTTTVETGLRILKSTESRRGISEALLGWLTEKRDTPLSGVLQCCLSLRRRRRG